MMFLDFESQVAHAGKVSLDKFLTVLFPLFKDALVTNLLGFGTSTTRLEWFAVFSDRKFARYSRSCLCRFGHDKSFIQISTTKK